MLRSLLSVVVLAFCAAFVLLIGGGSELEHVALLGAVLGGVIGLVPHDPPLGKLGGFALGFVTTWAFFGIRAALLPDTTMGRAVAAFLVVLIAGVGVAISNGRVPFWSVLVGVAAMSGAYETSFTDSPPQFMTTSPLAATSVLLAAGFGFLGAVIFTTFVKGPDAPRDPGPRPDPADDHDLLESVMSGESK